MSARLFRSSVQYRGRCRYFADLSTAKTAPLLLRIRNDMKAAMKAKDSARLDVLRGLISDTTTAAKSQNPVITDSQMLNVIRKRIKSAEGAVCEFDNAQRKDLRDKEAAQILVMNEYIEGSDLMGKEDVAIAVETLIGDMRSQGMKMDKGTVIKALLGPGGSLDGRLVDRKNVANLVEGLL